MTPVREVALLFLRLGVTAFGGPAAHLAMMEEEVVRRRKWLTHEELLDLIGAANLIPGPNSTEVAIHVGLRVAGPVGLVVAGACFIVPAALITLAIAWAYVRFGRMPSALGFLYGVKPVVVAVVAQAIFELARKAIKTRALLLLAVAAALASALGVHELIVLAMAALVAMVGVRPASAATIVLLPKSALAAPPLAKVFLTFAKTGSVLFGSGYVLLAFLRSDLVQRLGWLTEAQLVDAVAAGQMTPGPVFTTATFVGYVVAGKAGALVATLGIFLPAFVFVALTAPLIPRLRSSAVTSRLLDGVNVASLALMAVVAVRLAMGSLVDPLTVGLAVLALVLLVRFKVNSAWLVLAAGLVGWLVASARSG
jgi:chromate transporter